jgi:hypothetical protein
VFVAPAFAGRAFCFFPILEAALARLGKRGKNFVLYRGAVEFAENRDIDPWSRRDDERRWNAARAERVLQKPPVVGAHRTVRISASSEKVSRVLGLVLHIGAEDWREVTRREIDEQRMFFDATRTPTRPEIQDRPTPREVGGGKSRHRLAIWPNEARHRGELELTERERIEQTRANVLAGPQNSRQTRPHPKTSDAGSPPQNTASRRAAAMLRRNIFGAILHSAVLFPVIRERLEVLIST